MLRSLHLTHVGPASSLRLEEVAPRFNLITGDNGLGKSFVLDIAWWALTRVWHEFPAVPASEDAVIAYEFDGDVTVHSKESPWNVAAQEWRRQPGRPPNPGLVLYARVDGSFSVWDPARNYRLYRRAADGGESESPAAYQFTPAQVLHGLKRTVREAGIEREQTLCAGLIEHWTRWQDSQDPRFELLTQLLKHIGPDEQALEPGDSVRPSLDDERRIPTIRMPYGQDVPITYAPAGVKRMAKLAYLLAWAFSEHKQEADRIGNDLSRQVIVLLDEPETHLHPRWQRTVLPSLLKSVQEWNPDVRPDVQFMVATHSPLVLASMEPTFDPDQDALWKLDLVSGDVVIERSEWRRRGDINRWLVSDVFDLGAATSRQAEAALKLAAELLDQEVPDPQAVRNANDQLVAVLPEMDPFLIRWHHYMKEHLAPADAP